MIDEGLVDHDGEWRSLADYHPDLAVAADRPVLPRRTCLPATSTSQWAPNRTALEGWLRGSGFEPLRTWQHAFRGGATARKVEAKTVGERQIDEAASWDMTTGEVFKSTTMGRSS